MIAIYPIFDTSPTLSVEVAKCGDCTSIMNAHTITEHIPCDGSPVRAFCPHCDSENITYDKLVGMAAETFLLPY